VSDISRLSRREAHLDEDFIDIPEVFSKVINSDANFETTTHNCAQKLRIYFQKQIVGHKLLLYAYDPDKKDYEESRKRLFDFFKDKLGFNDDEIIRISLSEIVQSKQEQFKMYYEKFSQETRDLLKSRAVAILDAFK